MKRSFDDWMKIVDYAIRKKVGLSHMDLDDWDYRSAYDDGVNPAVAASRAIRNAGG